MKGFRLEFSFSHTKYHIEDIIIHQGCFDNDAIIKQSGFIIEKIPSVSDSAVGVDGQRNRA
jgi:hypothetical protein